MSNRASPYAASYLRCLEHLNLDGALDLVLGLQRGRMDVVAIVDEVLCPAQVEVGLRWEAGQWSVAREHAASAITAEVVAALRADRRPARARTLVVCCPEGELHDLGAAMLVTVMRSRGWRVIELAQSTPTLELDELLRAVAPVAVGVSCAAASALPAAWGLTALAHGVGIPVLAGGRGFGGAARRALALGAAGWARDTAGAARVLDGWAADPPAVRSRGPLPGEAARLLRLMDASPPVEARDPPDHDALQDADRRLLLGAVTAAALTGDPALLAEELAWRDRWLAPRGVDGDRRRAWQALVAAELKTIAAPRAHLLEPRR